MKKSFFWAIAAFALSAATAVISTASRSYDYTAKAVSAAAAFAGSFVLHALHLANPQAEAKAAGVVGFVQAKAFVLRFIKRERPVIESGWNLSPSV